MRETEVWWWPKKTKSGVAFNPSTEHALRDVVYFDGAAVTSPLLHDL